MDLPRRHDLVPLRGNDHTRSDHDADSSALSDVVTTAQDCVGGAI